MALAPDKKTTKRFFTLTEQNGTEHSSWTLW
jgi:hypothetical protein